MTNDAPADAELAEGLVWHYTDGAGLLSMLSNHVLWATSSEFLNDSQEVQLGFQRIIAELQRRAEQGVPLAEQLMKNAEQAKQDQRSISPGTFFILSAAQHWDLLAMWRCYGGPKESYAIGLDAGSPLPVLCDHEVAPPDFHAGRILRQRNWTPVRYDPVEQQQLAAAVFDGMQMQYDRMVDLAPAGLSDGELQGPEKLEGVSDILDDMEQALVLIKHEGFHDEREVRHTTMLADADGLHGWVGAVRYRATTYGVAPYVWLTGTSDASNGLTTTVPAPLPIRAVAISPSPNGEESTRSLAAMLRSRGYDVPVLRSRIPFRG